MAEIAAVTERLLKAAEVAAVFRVDPRTVDRWRIAGLLPAVQTPGGHWRYPLAGVEVLLRAGADESSDGERGREPGADTATSEEIEVDQSDVGGEDR